MNLEPGRLPKIKLKRGMWRKGFRLACVTLAGEPSAQVVEWTPHMQVRKSAGGALLLTLACSMDESTVVVGPITTPLTMPLGTWPVELAFVDGDGNKRGPFAAGEVVVTDVVTLPPDS